MSTKTDFTKKVPRAVWLIILFLSFSLSNAFELKNSITTVTAYFPYMTQYMSSFLLMLLASCLLSLVVFLFIVNVAYSYLKISLPPLKITLSDFNHYTLIALTISNLLKGISGILYCFGDIYYAFGAIIIDVFTTLLVFLLYYLFLEKRYIEERYKFKFLLVFMLPIIIVELVNVLVGVVL